MFPNPGDRVGAILSGKGNTVKFLGYGVYVGDEIPPNTGPNSMTAWMEEDRVPNPKIQLDNGDVVWGCECWWGPEDRIRKKLEQYDQVDIVRIGDYRG